MSKASLRAWTEDDCRRAHEATLNVLNEVGVEVKHAPAIDMFRKLGVRVEDNRVYLTEELVAEALESAPSRWELRGRPPGTESLRLDVDHSYFGTGSDCLYFADPSCGRRRTRLQDIEDMALLCEQLEAIDFVMSMGLPEDVPLAVDDLASAAAMLKGTHKPLIVAAKNGEHAARVVEMAEACGEGRSVAIYAMPSPPLMHDADALSKVMACAKLSVPLIYAPAPAAGAATPASIPATVIVGNAEVLSGLVVHQAVHAGAPFIYGAGYSALNMKTMVDCYAAPEHFLGNQLGCDLARYYDLPSFSYAAVSDAKVLDEQCAAEYGLTTILGALSGATLLHDVGYLESGLQSSQDAIVLGAEIIGWARAFLRDVAPDDFNLALDEIAAVGPGGSHLSRAYTRERYREWWVSSLFDQRPHGQWASAGAPRLHDILRRRTQELSEKDRPYQLDGSVSDRLDELVEQALPNAGARTG